MIQIPEPLPVIPPSTDMDSRKLMVQWRKFEGMALWYSLPKEDEDGKPISYAPEELKAHEEFCESMMDKARWKAGIQLQTQILKIQGPLFLAADKEEEKKQENLIFAKCMDLILGKLKDASGELEEDPKGEA